MSDLNFQTATYTGTGDQTEMKLNQGASDVSKGQVVAATDDIWTLQVRMCPDANLINHPDYISQSGNRPFWLKGKYAGVALNITTNTSQAIKLQVNPER